MVGNKIVALCIINGNLNRIQISTFYISADVTILQVYIFLLHEINKLFNRNYDVEVKKYNTFLLKTLL